MSRLEIVRDWIQGIKAWCLNWLISSSFKGLILLLDTLFMKTKKKKKDDLKRLCQWLQEISNCIILAIDMKKKMKSTLIHWMRYLVDSNKSLSD